MILAGTLWYSAFAIPAGFGANPTATAANQNMKMLLQTLILRGHIKSTCDIGTSSDHVRAPLTSGED